MSENLKVYQRVLQVAKEKGVDLEAISLYNLVSGHVNDLLYIAKGGKIGKRISIGVTRSLTRAGIISNQKEGYPHRGTFVTQKGMRMIAEIQDHVSMIQLTRIKEFMRKADYDGLVEYGISQDIDVNNVSLSFKD